LESNKSSGSEEIKAFLREGLRSYAPALAALSEFRRQIQVTIQAALSDFSPQFSGLGLSVGDLKLVRAKVDDQGLPASSFKIELQKNHGNELYTGYYLAWNSERPREWQVQVGAWIYAGVRTDRDRLFGALKERRLSSKGAELEQNSVGSAVLFSYCDPDAFDAFGDDFRTLIRDWVEILASVGGVRPFLSTAISRSDTPPNTVLDG
jgi:hypothetical protein